MTGLVSFVSGPLRLSVVSLHGLSEGYLDFLHGSLGPQKCRSRSCKTLLKTVVKPEAEPVQS